MPTDPVCGMFVPGLEIANERFAKGEISEAEYRQMIEIIRR